MWKENDKKLSELNNLKGRASYLKDCIYLAIGFEKIPNVLSPGNKLNRERMKELTEDEEWPKTTILLWKRTAFHIS